MGYGMSMDWFLQENFNRKPWFLPWNYRVILPQRTKYDIQHGVVVPHVGSLTPTCWQVGWTTNGKQLKILQPRKTNQGRHPESRTPPARLGDKWIARLGDKWSGDIRRAGHHHLEIAGHLLRKNWEPNSKLFEKKRKYTAQVCKMICLKKCLFSPWVSLQILLEEMVAQKCTVYLL